MNSSVLKLSSVEFSDSSISEKEGNKIILTIPRERIVSVSFCHGISAERPIVDAIVGIVFILVGVYIFWPFFWETWHQILLAPGSSPSPRYPYPTAKFTILGLIPIPIGIMIIVRAFQRRYFLSITNQNGRKRKIVFYEKLSYNEIRSFLENAKRAYGYNITVRTPE